MDLTIIVPYRNRERHLKMFIPHLSTLFGLQKKSGIQILIIEQADDKPFNRGKLLNIGSKFARNNTIVFHDVDMLPQYNVSYEPLPGATHLAGKASQFKYRMPYPEYFGGVTMFEKSEFDKINGFSNDFWGWGCEDDDLYFRAKYFGVPIKFMPYRFQSLSHERKMNAELYANNVSSLNNAEANLSSGLSNLNFTLLEKSIIKKTEILIVEKIRVEL